MEYALLQLVVSAEEALTLDTQMNTLGYGLNPYGRIFGGIADAIYYIIGEETETFDSSVTYLALHSSGLTGEQRVSMLMNEYMKNHP